MQETTTKIGEHVLPNIDYLGQSTIDSVSALYTIKLYKPEEYFINIESRTNFINGVERLVRSSDRYSKYKNHLMHEVGLGHCAVLKGLTEDDCDIELHHGPVFTLFDICSIIVEYYILRRWKITTFRIADTVLTEHELDRVNCVMLSSSVHEQVHLRNVFISMKQTWGDIQAFIEKYYDAIGPELRMKYNRYFDRSLLEDSDDSGMFMLNPYLLSN